MFLFMIEFVLDVYNTQKQTIVKANQTMFMIYFDGSEIKQKDRKSYQGDLSLSH